MDGLSTAASIIAVIQIAGQVIDLCHTYYSEVKDARTDIERLRDEMTSLQDVLSKLRDLTKAPGSTDLSIFSLLNQPDGPVQRCLTDSIALVAKLSPGQGKGKMRPFGLRALKWPFSSKEIDKAITNIGRHKATFNLALAADQTALALAINQGVTEGVTELRQLSEATQIEVAATRADVAAARTDVAATRADILAHRTGEYREKIIQWLSKTDPSSNYHSARKKRQLETGEWLIKRPQFEEWKWTQNSLLWLHGKPGCGKTILSSTVIEHMEYYCKSKSSLAIVYFYFDFNDVEKQNAPNCTSSLIAQLCSETVDPPEMLKDLYKRCNEGKQKADLHDLLAVLRIFAVADELQDLFIVLDALDECPKDDEKESRNELLDFITEVKSWSSSKIHLLVTSRPEPDIAEKLAPLLTAPAISIEGSEVKGDIKKHIKSQLATHPKLKAWPADIKAHIERTLAEKANGMFRWVFCQLDALKKCRKKSALLEALKTLPKTLDDTYARILAGIEKDYQKEARRALIWLAFSRRPLSIEELAEAAVVDSNRSPPFHPDERLRDPCNDIIEILGSLVTISSKGVSTYASDDGSDSDSGSSSNADLGVRPDDSDIGLTDLNSKEVRLAHFSVKEYLLSDRIGISSVSEFRATSGEADQLISESCLLYIFHYDESDSKTTSLDDLGYFPLLPYACQFWYIHAKSIPEESRKSIGPIIFKLFLSDTALVAWLQVHRPDMPGEPPFIMSEEVDLSLYYASCLGLEAVVRWLLEHKADVNAKDSYGWTALIVAAKEGREVVVRLLVEHKADVNAKDNYGKTALHTAARHGREAIVQLLLEHKADVNAKVNYGKTALHRAAEWGHEMVVRLLLEHKADIHARDINGKTALHIAAENGHEAVVRLLETWKESH